MTAPPPSPVLRYDCGEIVFAAADWNETLRDLVGRHFTYNSETNTWRAPGLAYATVALALHKRRLPWRDEARAYEKLSLTRHGPPARHYQAAALFAWRGAERCGVVVLPTGAGKTMVAGLAIADAGRPTLVLVPTLELLRQWREYLAREFALPVGALGGGEHQLEALTVSTYDSALIAADRIGNRFGLLIADECHHLPAAASREIARRLIAPFRLGLTATPERPDGGHEAYAELLGPVVYTKEIAELRGSYLSNYDTRRIRVSLSETERLDYEAARSEFKRFLLAHEIDLSDPKGWAAFLAIAFRSAEGRLAYAAWRRQREIALAPAAKISRLLELLCEHKDQRVLVFTDSNDMAYRIAESFLLPVITHQTPAAEREAVLRGFKDGSLPRLVTSRVLNEGVDVPEASVGIVVSGSASVREHVQRLGRILRPRAGKQAVLYELLSDRTMETGQSARRRKHNAYQKSAAIPRR